MEHLDEVFDGRVLALSSNRDGLRGREWAPHSPGKFWVIFYEEIDPKTYQDTDTNRFLFASITIY